ncbi:MAG: hypothetical protein NC092_02105 [Butyrivibrio sp.]|nr:hypothetical protein [Butyrivibrio sp.]
MKLILKGTKYELKWFHKILQQHKKVEIDSKGKMYPSRDSRGNVIDGVYRQDYGIKKANMDKKDD